jgi:hypothetical protein
MCGQFINKVSVKCDYDNGLDKNFDFVTVTDGTEKDMVNTINKALRQKSKEGELDSQNLRSVEIKSNDEKGFFGTFVVKNIKEFVESL